MVLENSTSTLHRNNAWLYRLFILFMCIVFLINIFYDNVYKIIITDKLQIFKSAEKLHVLGMEAVENEEYQDALKYFTWEIEKDRGALEGYYELGDLYFQAERYGEAIEVYRSVLEFDQLNETANLGIVRSLIQQKRVDDALFELNRIIEADDGFAFAYLYRGVIYNLTNKQKEAIDDLNRVIEIEPDNLEAWVLRSGILVEQGDYQKGAEGYGYILANFESLDNKNEIYIIITALYYDNAEYEKCIEYANMALIDYENDLNLLGLRAECYLNIGEYLRAADDYRKYVEIAGEDNELFNSLGHALYLAEDYENSLESFGKADAIENTAKSKYNLALVLTVLGRYEEAAQRYGEAISLDEENEEIYYKLRAYVYGEMEDFENAINDLNYYLECVPDDTEAVFNLGLSYYNIQDFYLANDCFTKVIESSSGYGEAYYYRGICYSMMGEHALAAEDYLYAVNNQVLPAESNYNLAMAYLNLEEYEKALECLKTAKDLTENEDMKSAIDEIIADVEDMI